eukprot:9490733-Pyramimonas_sp.AAC.1
MPCSCVFCHAPMCYTVFMCIICCRAPMYYVWSAILLVPLRGLPCSCVFCRAAACSAKLPRVIWVMSCSCAPTV